MKKGWIVVFVLLLGLLGGCRADEGAVSPSVGTGPVVAPAKATETPAVADGTFRGETWQAVYREILLADPESYLPEADGFLTRKTEEAWEIHLPTGEIVPLDEVFTSQVFFWE